MPKGTREASSRRNIWVNPTTCKREYVLVAEKALGKELPAKAIVHHHTPTQLVICQDQAYHLLLHARTKALKECGNPDLRKCIYCGRYDAQTELKYYRSNRNWRHPSCGNQRRREIYWRNRNAS